jgi:hypothetical protein
VNAALPPNGPASAAFCTLTMQTLLTPATVPSHVMPAGIWTVIGKSVAVVPERPPTPEPGTSVTIVAGTKAAGFVPPEVGSIAGVRGPAPSWFTCLFMLEKDGTRREMGWGRVACKVLGIEGNGRVLSHLMVDHVDGAITAHGR